MKVEGGPYKSGQRFGPYVLEKYLGSGAFKSVYRARNEGQEITEPVVAIAFPHQQDAEGVKLLRREFDNQCQLEHPNIMRVFNVEEHDGQCFLVMDYLDGHSLRTMLTAGNTQRPMEQDVSVRHVGRLAEALDYTHSANVLHRDIKPDNVFITGDSVPKLLDFGIARIIASRSRASSRVGTINYMAPEVFDGASGRPADIWSLGVTFYEMLTGLRPFDGQNEAETMRNIIQGTLDVEPLRKQGIDDRVIAVVEKMLEKNPDERYSAHELADALSIVARHVSLADDDEKQLEILIKASFALVNIISFEEERVIAAVRNIAGRLGEVRGKPFPLYIWSASRGLRDENDKLLDRDSLGDPSSALLHVISSPEDAFFLFLDIHRHFSPVTIRLVRDAARAVRTSNKTMLFLMPMYNLPAELEKEASLIGFSLPGRKRLEKLVARMEDLVTAKGMPVLGQDDQRALVRAASGLTENEAERAILASAHKLGGFLPGIDREVVHQKTQIIRKSGILEYYPTAETFNDVGGLKNLLEWFMKRLPAFDEEGKYAGLPTPNGVLLVGVPGCGKSLTARALSGAWRVPLLRLDIGRVFGAIVGRSEANLRRALATAEAVSPCILWIDEVEKAFAGSDSSSKGSGVAARVFGGFLSWMQEKTAPVFVVATANDISQLPAEFLRAGRFDEKFFVGLPEDAAREAIFRIHLRKHKRDPEAFDLHRLVQQTRGFTGAEIEQIIVDGLFRAFAAREEDPGRDLVDVDMTDAIGATKPLSQSRGRQIQSMMQWAQDHARMAG